MGHWHCSLSAADWQLRYLFRLGLPSWIIHLAVVVLAWLILRATSGDPPWLSWWLIAMVIASLALALLSIGLSGDKKLGLVGLRYGGMIHTMATGLVGALWGAGAFGSATGSFEGLAFYTIALGGTALGAVSSQHAVLRSCFVSLWTSLPCLAAAHYWRDDLATGIPMAVMILLYALVLSILSIRMCSFLVENQALTLSLEEKVAQLTATTNDLAEANRTKSRFLAQASHDLRQPIHAVGLLTAALKDMRLNGEQRQVVETIDHSIESAMNLFASLLDISRLEVGGITPKPAPTDIGALLERLVAQNLGFAAQNNCRFRHVDSRRWVETDANLLFTMLQNILGNAFKYAPGCRVLIGPRMRSGCLAIQICDTGPGIAADQLDAVFHEFYRLDAKAGRSIEGMGLGLTIVRLLADLLDLTVTLTSLPDKGTSVMVSGLQMIEPQPETIEVTEISTTKKRRSDTLKRRHPLAGKRICLLDDNDDVRAATVLLLQRWGCIINDDIVPETMPRECDAIIADFALRDAKDGLDAIIQLRQKAGRDMPAIILTGDVGADTAARIAAAGVPMLQKPVKPVELRALLTRVCLDISGH